MARTNGPVGRERLVTYSQPRSAVAEAYRQLRTNIQFSSLDRPIRTLLVTSTSPDEGKSTTLANLAITIAQTGNRVVLVDCDLRRPTMHTVFGVKNGTGVTGLMLSDGGEEAALQESGIPNLLLLPSGPLPPNPSELLSSRRLSQILDRLSAVADYVLLDSPPVIAVTDAAVLASKVDGVLLVVRAGKTKREMARKAKQLLEKVNARLVGVVLNDVKYDTSLHHYFAEQESPA
ncbi:MAG: CpsD/CapB family tyrosine-protein kinase [Chloroflexi bacterium]|nr:CpsD/CapB family tyrosine-protein kinase [Chloroflexota bacterium]